MPFYDYECSTCGHAFELRQSFDSPPEGVCPHCSGKARRKFHAVPIIYKGSGFYTTDYKRTGHSPPSGKEDGHKAKEESSKTDDSSASKDKEAASTKAGDDSDS